MTALTFRAVIDDPTRFADSRTVGAYFGLAPRRLQSGQTYIGGRISKFGDQTGRMALYEAAMVLLTHSKSECRLRKWGLKLAQRRGYKLAATACARKLAVLLHRLWVTGRP